MPTGLRYMPTIGRPMQDRHCPSALRQETLRHAWRSLAHTHYSTPPSPLLRITPHL